MYIGPTSKLFLHSLHLFYKLTLLFFTVYTCFKSFNEYFCWQARADHPNSIQHVEVDLFIKSDFNDASDEQIKFGMEATAVVDGEVQVFGVKIGGNNSHYLLTQPVKIIDTNKNTKYKKGKNYYTIKRRYLTGESRRGHKTDDEGNHLIVFRNYVKTGADGAFLSKKDSLFYYIAEDGDHEVTPVALTLEKSFETCATNQKTTEYFQFGYICSALLLIFICSLRFVKWKGDIINVWFNQISKHLDVDTKYKFCNPVTNDPVYYHKGDLIFKLGKQIVQINEMCMSNNKSNNLMDTVARYSISSKFELLVQYIDNSIPTALIKLDEHSKPQLQYYFYNVNLSHKNCILNDKEDHFLSTLTVINKVNEGLFINLSEKQTDGYVLDVHELEYELIKSTYNMNNDILKVLLQHNFNFFGSYNLESLMCVLENKLSFYHRPNKVSNTQWKWYTSDYVRYMQKFGVRLKSQCNWGMSEALKQAMIGEIKIIPIQEKLVVDKTIVVEQKTVKRLDDFISNTYHYLREQVKVYKSGLIESGNCELSKKIMRLSHRTYDYPHELRPIQDDLADAAEPVGIDKFDLVELKEMELTDEIRDLNVTICDINKFLMGNNKLFLSDITEPDPNAKKDLSLLSKQINQTRKLLKKDPDNESLKEEIRTKLEYYDKCRLNPARIASKAVRRNVDVVLKDVCKGIRVKLAKQMICKDFKVILKEFEEVNIKVIKNNMLSRVDLIDSICSKSDQRKKKHFAVQQKKGKKRKHFNKIYNSKHLQEGLVVVRKIQRPRGAFLCSNLNDHLTVAAACTEHRNDLRSKTILKFKFMLAKMLRGKNNINSKNRFKNHLITTCDSFLEMPASDFIQSYKKCMGGMHSAIEEFILYLDQA